MILIEKLSNKSKDFDRVIQYYSKSQILEILKQEIFKSEYDSFIDFCKKVLYSTDIDSISNYELLDLLNKYNEKIYNDIITFLINQIF